MIAAVQRMLEYQMSQVEDSNSNEGNEIENLKIAVHEIQNLI